MNQPTNLAGKMGQMKSLLVNAENFADPMDYFFDVLLIDPAFRAKGKTLRDKNIEQRFLSVIKILHQQMAPGVEAKPKLLAMVWLKQFEFAHGAFTLSNLFGATFYFRDLDMGLCALGSMNGPAEVLFSRFSVYDQVDPSKSFHIDRSRRRH